MVTSVRSFSSMCTEVSSKIRMSRISFVTESASIGLFSSVNTQMQFQVLCQSKRFSTMLTLVWFLTRVRSLMSFQVCRNWKRSIANRALEWFVTAFSRFPWTFVAYPAVIMTLTCKERLLRINPKQKWHLVVRTSTSVDIRKKMRCRIEF